MNCWQLGGFSSSIIKFGGTRTYALSPGWAVQPRLLQAVKLCRTPKIVTMTSPWPKMPRDDPHSSAHPTPGLQPLHMHRAVCLYRLRLCWPPSCTFLLAAIGVFRPPFFSNFKDFFPPRFSSFLLFCPSIPLVSEQQWWDKITFFSNTWGWDEASHQPQYITEK